MSDAIDESRLIAPLTKCDTCGRVDIVLLAGFHRWIFCQWCGSSEKVEPDEAVSPLLSVVHLGVQCPSCGTHMFPAMTNGPVTTWLCVGCGLAYQYDATTGVTSEGEHVD